MEQGFRIQHNSKLFIQGCILAALGVAGPAVIMEQKLRIYHSLTLAMMGESGSHLVIAALKLVVMNVLRMIPHYLGVFLINESARIYIYGKKRFIFNVVITFFMIVFIYDVIDWVYGIHYDLGMPALLTISFVLFLSYIDLFSVSMLNKILILASLLMSFQWLDVIPPLSQYGFGGGEISIDVKKASEFIREQQLLTVFALSMCLVFFYTAMMQVQLAYKEHKLKISNEKTLQVEKQLHDTQIEALKMRNSSEVQNLVHDLKTPLTTIQGLISLSEMMEQNPLIQEYMKKISSSLTSMSMMISEILYENKWAPMKTSELMNTVLAQISILIPNDMLIYENHCPDALIQGNKIRLSRAVVNLMTNAYNAVDKKTGRLKVTVERRLGYINIIILDNGSGIAAKELDQIWEIGYSGSQSTGMGLAFTRQVIEKHGGNIWIESEKGRYTRAVVRLREGNEDGEQEDNSGD